MGKHLLSFLVLETAYSLHPSSVFRKACGERGEWGNMGFLLPTIVSPSLSAWKWTSEWLGISISPLFHPQYG